MWPRDANSPRPEPRHWSGFAKRMPFPLLRLGFPCPRPKDGRGDEDGGGNFHGQQRKNDTHASTSDPDSRLYRKAAGREAKLCYMGHATMENRHGLAVAGRVTLANGTAERRASERMLKAPKPRKPAAAHGGRRQGL